MSLDALSADLLKQILLNSFAGGETLVLVGGGTSMQEQRVASHLEQEKRVEPEIRCWRLH